MSHDTGVITRGSLYTREHFALDILFAFVSCDLARALLQRAVVNYRCVVTSPYYVSLLGPYYSVHDVVNYRYVVTSPHHCMQQ